MAETIYGAMWGKRVHTHLTKHMSVMWTPTLLSVVLGSD